MKKDIVVGASGCREGMTSRWDTPPPQWSRKRMYFRLYFEIIFVFSILFLKILVLNLDMLQLMFIIQLIW